MFIIIADSLDKVFRFHCTANMSPNANKERIAYSEFKCKFLVHAAESVAVTTDRTVQKILRHELDANDRLYGTFSGSSFTAGEIVSRTSAI